VRKPCKAPLEVISARICISWLSIEVLYQMPDESIKTSAMTNAGKLKIYREVSLYVRVPNFRLKKIVLIQEEDL